MTPRSAAEQADEWASENTFTDSRFTAKQAFLAGHLAGLKLAGELAAALESVKRFAYTIPGKTADDIWIQCRDVLEKYKAAQGE